MRGVDGQGGRAEGPRSRGVAVDTNAPYLMSFDSADGGKINYVWLRWVSPTGERGPWSEQAQATIAA